MSNLNSEDHYILLETNQPETILDSDQIHAKLKSVLEQNPDRIPVDLRSLTPDEQVRSLLDTVCELDMDADQYLQWYAIRLEK